MYSMFSRSLKSLIACCCCSLSCDFCVTVPLSTIVCQLYVHSAAFVIIFSHLMFPDICNEDAHPLQPTTCFYDRLMFSKFGILRRHSVVCQIYVSCFFVWAWINGSMNLALRSPNNWSASNQIYRLDNGNRNLIIPCLTKLLPSVYKMSCFAILLLSWPSVSSCGTLCIWQQKTECCLSAYICI